MRQKQVGDYDWVIATWIAQSQPSGGSPYANGNHGWAMSTACYTGRRMFFEGDTIYDYHKGWPMARLLGNGRALLNAERYSATTSCHTRRVEGALLAAEIRIFQVERQGGQLVPLPAYLLAEYRKQVVVHERMRDRLAWRELRSLRYARQQYLDFCREFGLPVEFDLDKADWKRLELRVKRYKELREAKAFRNKLVYGREMYA